MSLPVNAGRTVAAGEQFAPSEFVDLQDQIRAFYRGRRQDGHRIHLHAFHGAGQWSKTGSNLYLASVIPSQSHVLPTGLRRTALVAQVACFVWRNAAAAMTFALYDWNGALISSTPSSPATGSWQTVTLTVSPWKHVRRIVITSGQASDRIAGAGVVFNGAI